MKTTMGLYPNAPKNLSYIPLPKPIRRKFPSTPRTGTIAISIFVLKKEFGGSLILNLFVSKGKRNFTILKLLPCIKGTNILYFRRSFIKYFSRFGSCSIGIKTRIFLTSSRSSKNHNFFSTSLSAFGVIFAIVLCLQTFRKFSLSKSAFLVI